MNSTANKESFAPDYDESGKGMVRGMKKGIRNIFSIGVSMVVALSGLTLVSSAAGAPSYTAKYGTPTVDGTVNSSEYGPAQNLNKDNTGIFFGMVDLDDSNLDIHYPEITYRFAWNENNFYVGITAAEIEDIGTSKFQIDISPENKVRDGQKGVFYTFSVLNLDSGLVSVARDNYQTGGSKQVSMNITKKVTAKAKKTSKGAEIEIAIPLAELQVAGQGRDFSKITLKKGKWGIGTYFIGNGLGFTTTMGKCHYTEVTENLNAGSLIEHYNPITFAAKPSTTTSQPSTSRPSGNGNTTPGKTESNTNPSNTNSAAPVASGGATASGGTTDTSGGTTVNSDGTTVPGGTTDVQSDDGTTDAASDGNSSEISTGSDEKPKSNTGLIVGLVIGGVVVIGAGVLIFLKVKKII